MQKAASVVLGICSRSTLVSNQSVSGLKVSTDTYVVSRRVLPRPQIYVAYVPCMYVTFDFGYKLFVSFHRGKAICSPNPTRLGW